MKTLVVFYSRTGTTKKVAEVIKEKLNTDIEEIIDKKSRKGIMGWLSGGKDAATKSITEIEKPKKDPSKYDLIIIGTPVWAGKMAPAIRTYLKDAKVKKAAFFTTQGSATDQGAFSDMTKSLGKKPVAELILSTKEVKQGADSKIIKFTDKIK